MSKIIIQPSVIIPQGQHHVLSAQYSYAPFGRVPTWLGDQIRITCGVISYFSFLFFLPFPRQNQ